MSEYHYFLSDLHLFSRRSRAERHLDEIVARAGHANTIVLGGDIFDFRWTTLPTISDTIDAAVEWLDDFVSNHPECQFHFVLGNHDSHRDFVRLLGELADETQNLEWHPHHVRLGRSLFLHGDVTDGARDEMELAARRDRWQEDRKKGRLANVAYDLAIQARLHSAISKCLHRDQRVVSRVHNYVENVGHGQESGLEHVYFGHTHSSLDHYHFGGLRYHNGGAPIDGLEFRIVEAVIEH